MKMCPLTARRVGWQGAGSGKMQETGNRSASGSQLTATAAIASLCMNGTLRCSAQTSGTPTTKSKLAFATKLFYDG